MSESLDLDRIATALGAERGGKVKSSGGFFGAVQLAAEVRKRFHDTEERCPTSRGEQEHLIRLSASTLEQLEQLAEQAHATPMQVAALLLERAVQSAFSPG